MEHFINTIDPIDSLISLTGTFTGPEDQQTFYSYCSGCQRDITVLHYTQGTLNAVLYNGSSR